jgi:hypothetical protein
LFQRTDRKGEKEVHLETHVGLYVKILQVEGMLPNVNTDNGDMGKKRVLVGCGDNLEPARGGVVALRNPRCEFVSILRNPPCQFG